MIVAIPTHLRSYTGQAQVEVGGSTLGEGLAELDRRYPGLRFRIVDEQDAIREHIVIVVNNARVPDLTVPVSPTDRVRIIAALSGG